MNPTGNTIQMDFQKLAKSHADHDAAMKRASVANWLAECQGPIRIDVRDVNLSIDAGLAFACVRPLKCA